MLKVIDVEDTPNPDALKFVLDGTILASGVRQFESPQAAQSDALASSLFMIPGAQSVFYTGKFVTVSKDPDTRWSHIQPKINQAIAEKGKPVSANGHSTTATLKSTDDPMLAQIN